MTALPQPGPDPVLDAHASLADVGALRRESRVEDLCGTLRDEAAPAALDPECAERWSAALEPLDPPAATRASLQQLREGGAWAVVSGQQATIATGPYLSIAKAVHTVRLARELQARTGTPVVPVFWIASDDHDLAEVQTTQVVNAQRQTQRIRLELPAVRTAVSELRVPDEAQGIVARLLQLADAGAEPEEWMEPRDGERMADWFARLLLGLLGDHGLLPVEPSTLLPAAEPLFRQVLEDPGGWRAAFEEGSELVRRAGFEPPLPSSPIPLFEISESDRRRVEDPLPYLQRGVASYCSVEPPRLSPDAALRPLLQDRALPVLCYVAGPTEMRYWAQLGPAHRHLGVRFPAVVPRMSVQLLPRRVARLLRKLGLDLAQGLALLEPAPEPTEPEVLQQGAELQAHIERWVEELGALHPSVRRATARRTEQLQRQFSLTLEQARSSWSERSQRSSEAAAWLQAYLRPGDREAERSLNVLPFVAEQGSSLIDAWLDLDLEPRRWTLLLE